MKYGKKLLLTGSLVLGASAAHAGSGLYEVEVFGLQGLNIMEGATVWQPEPAYPRMALRRRLEGEVLVRYSISSRGKAENIQILDSSPRGFFNNATVRTLKDATFGVTYREGEAVPLDGVTKRFIYKIEEESAGGTRTTVAIN